MLTYSLVADILHSSDVRCMSLQLVKTSLQGGYKESKPQIKICHILKSITKELFIIEQEQNSLFNMFYRFNQSVCPFMYSKLKHVGIDYYLRQMDHHISKKQKSINNKVSIS